MKKFAKINTHDFSQINTREIKCSHYSWFFSFNFHSLYNSLIDVKNGIKIISP